MTQTKYLGELPGPIIVMSGIKLCWHRRRLGQVVTIATLENPFLIAQPELVTARLRLRPFFASDLEQVVQLANDPQVCQFLRSFSFPYSTDDARQWIDSLAQQWEQGHAATFAICQRDSADADVNATATAKTKASSPVPHSEKPAEPLLGTIGVVIDQQSNRGELGYWIGRAYWGRGIATAAGFSMLDFAFGELGLNKVVAECLEQNPASARVLENLGMQQEGYLLQHFRKHEEDDYSNVFVYGILRDAWNRRI